MLKKQGRVFLFVFFYLLSFQSQIWVKNFLEICIQWLRKALAWLVYMRFDCIPPEFSPFRNFKKNIGKLNSLTVRKKKKKKKKSRPTDPIFKFMVGWGQHNIFFFWPYVISAFCLRLTRRCVGIIVPFVLTAGSVLGINPEGIKTVSGIFQEYADRLRNECGFTQLDSASCPHLVRALVDVRSYRDSHHISCKLINK